MGSTIVAVDALTGRLVPHATTVIAIVIMAVLFAVPADIPIAAELAKI
jgi:hypothetical protein